MSIYWFDLVAGVLLLVFAGFGWRRGLVKEFFFTGAWVGGYLAALFYYQRAAHFLKGFIPFAPLADLLGFLAVFAGVYLLARLMEYIVREKIGLKMPRAVDAPGGLVMGLIKGFVVLALFMLALGYWPPAHDALLANSYLMRWTRYLAHPRGPLGMDVRPSGDLKNDFDELKQKIPDLKDLKGSLPAVPTIPEAPKESPPPVTAPRKTPAQAPEPPSPKITAQKPPVSPPQPLSPRKAPAPPPVSMNKTPPPGQAAASMPPAPAPRVKQVEPVRKNLPEAVAAPPEDENRRMDKFIKSLD